MKYFSKIVFIFILLSAMVFTVCWAGEAKGGNLQSVEFLTGYGLAKVKRQVAYRIVPFFLDLGFDLKHLVQRRGINYPGLQQFIIEPFASYAYNSPANAEIGNNFAVKIGLLPEGWEFQPYVKVGLGLIYLTRHFRQQSTYFNFTEFIGCGIHYFLAKNTALTIEYRFRHLSNADIKRPNNGIGTGIGACGISYFF